jgi:hypothetical protein
MILYINFYSYHYYNLFVHYLIHLLIISIDYLQTFISILISLHSHQNHIFSILINPINKVYHISTYLLGPNSMLNSLLLLNLMPVNLYSIHSLINNMMIIQSIISSIFIYDLITLIHVHYMTHLMKIIYYDPLNNSYLNFSPMMIFYHKHYLMIS